MPSLEKGVNEEIGLQDGTRIGVAGGKLIWTPNADALAWAYGNLSRSQ